MSIQNYPACLDRLASFPRSLAALVAGISDADLRHQPASGDWSILEVLCHLADEEDRDFKPRLERTLKGEAWEPIDPEGWAITHDYNRQSPAETLARFATQREQSLAWIKSIGTPDWNRAHEHPKLGTMHAGTLFASWLAHDALHLRQIAKRMYELAVRDAGSFDTKYAGDW